MNRISILFIAFIYLVFSSCQKKEYVRPENSFMMNEDSQKGEMSVYLSWNINGKADNGMIGDLNIYLTNGDYENINQLESSTISSMDFYGKQKISPTSIELTDLYRYYIGVGYNGLLTTDPSITFPLTIDYTIEFKHANEASAAKTFKGTLIIQSDEKALTKIVYPYLMDINESTATDQYKSYSLKQMAQPIQILRECDVVSSNVLEGDAVFTVEARWKTANENLGYKKIDVNLFLHDTTKIPVTYEDLDAYSNNIDSYEHIFVSSSTTLFSNGNPKFMGFLYNKDLGLSTPDQVKIMFKITSYGSKKINRYVGYFTFNPAPIIPGNGKMYLLAKVTKENNAYTITNLPSVITF